MCWSSTKTTLLVVAVICMCMNGFNLVSRMTGIEDKIREEKYSSYLPDVTDISKWVNGRENSDHITEGLAGVSLIFDFILLGGAIKESAGMIQISGIWGSFDCVADAVIGFLAANYTLPSFSHEETHTVSHKNFKKRSMNRRHRAKDFPKMLPMKVGAADSKDDKDKKDGKGGGTHKRTEKREIGFREPPPTTAKQILHFAWVILRLIIKSQILCSLFSYVGFLQQRDAMMAKPLPAAGGGGGATSSMSVAE